MQNFFCGFSRTLRNFKKIFLKLFLKSEEQFPNIDNNNIHSLEHITTIVRDSVVHNAVYDQYNCIIFMRENESKINYIDVGSSCMRRTAITTDYRTYYHSNHNEYLALVTTKRDYESSSPDTIVKFIIDSGCSNHLTYADVHYMYKCVPIESWIGTAGGPPLRSTRRGSIGPLVNVLHVPDAKFSLLSISNFCDEDMTVMFNRDEVLFVKNEECERWLPTLKVVQKGFRENNLYAINIEVSNRNGSWFTPTVSHHSLVANAESTNRYTLWHNRFNHCGHESLRVIRESKRYPDMIWSDEEYIAHRARVCHGCAVGKMIVSSTRKQSRELISEKHPSNRPGGLILIDTFFSNIVSHTSKELGLIIVDAHSKCMWTRFGRSKDDVQELFQEWLMYMKGLKFNIGSICFVRSDNGGEFTSTAFVQVLNSFGISPERAPPYAHVNRAERAIRHVKETARAYINTNRINLSRLAVWRTNGRTSNPYVFWTDAINHSCQVFNMLPEKKFSKSGISRHERFFGTTPDLTRIKVFGCTAYVHIPRDARKSFDETSSIGVYLGFNPISPQTWRIMNIQSGKVNESRSVIFNENIDIQNT